MKKEFPQLLLSILIIMYLLNVFMYEGNAQVQIVKPRIVVYEYYYYRYPFIPIDPNTISSDDLKQFRFEKEEDALFHYINPEKSVDLKRDVYIRYVGYPYALTVFSVQEIGIGNQINEDLILAELINPEAGIRDRTNALYDFNRMLLQFRKDILKSDNDFPEKVPLINCILKTIPYDESKKLNKSKFSSESYEIYDKDGQLIVWKKAEDKGKILYILDYHPKLQEGIGGFEAENNLLWIFSSYITFIDWKTKQDLAYLESLFDVYKKQFDNDKDLFLKIRKNDPIATLTVIPILVLKDEIYKELLEININYSNKYIENYISYFTSAKNRQKTNIQIFFSNENLNGDRKEMENCLLNYTEDIYEPIILHMKTINNEIESLNNEVQRLYDIILPGGIILIITALWKFLGLGLPNMKNDIINKFLKREYIQIGMLLMLIGIMIYDILLMAIILFNRNYLERFNYGDILFSVSIIISTLLTFFYFKSKNKKMIASLPTSFE